MGLLDGILGSLFPPAPTPIAEASDGQLITIRGRVIPRDVLSGPLTGEPCVYYRYAAYVWRQSQMAGIAGDGFWETRASDEAIAEFYVADDSGQAIIAPADAKVEFARGVIEDSFETAVHEKATERRVVLGDIVEVTGIAGVVADLLDEGRGYRASADKSIIRAAPGEQLHIKVIERQTRAAS